MDLTILIATYNRAESLRRALSSLARCDVPEGLAWEVIIVGNGSTDHTPLVAEEARRGGLPVKYVSEPARGKSHALNTGIKKSSGEVVAFTDDDVLFDSRYLAEVWEGTRRHSGSSCFACRVLPRWPGPLPAWLVTDGPRRVPEGAINLADMGEEDADFPPGRVAGGLNAVVRRGALEGIGSFRTDMGPGTRYPFAEDTEFFSRLARRGSRFVYLGKAVLNHVNEPERMTKDYFLDWSYMAAFSNAQWQDLPVDARWCLGAPRYLYRSAASRLLGWLLTADGEKRFFLKRKLWHTLGEIRGWRERTRRLKIENCKLKIAKRGNEKTGESGDRADKSERHEKIQQLEIGNWKLESAKRKVKKSPRVSVVIPAYNAGAFIAETLDSVLAQTYGDFEIVVADDGSTDDTGERVKPFLSDPRVRYAWGENGGVARARNRGMALARGEFIAFLDADDLWPKDKLEKQMAIMDANPEVGLLCGDTAQFDEDGIWCKSWFAEKGLGPAFFGRGVVVPDAFGKLLDVCFVSMGTVLLRKEAVDEVGDFDEAFRCVEDLDIYLRIAQRHAIGWSPEVWVLRRCHASNISGNPAVLLANGIRVREKLIGIVPEDSREGRLLEGSLARSLYNAAYQAWMEDRFADAARDFKRSVRARFSFRALAYAAAAGLGGGTVGVLRGLRVRVRLSPPKMPEARLPAGRRGM